MAVSPSKKSKSSGYDDDCFVHGPVWTYDFEEALMTLKKRGILPGKIGKRAAYLVCTCKKKHTKLDDSFAAVGYVDLMKSLSDALGLEFPKDSAKKPTKSDDTDVEGKKEPLSDEKSEEESLTRSQRRFLVMVYHCYMCDTEILEPRGHHQEKVDAFRILNRGVYVRHHKSKYSRRPKYDVEKELVFRRPIITVAAFVGKAGKNINAITEDQNCKVKVEMRGLDIVVKVQATTDEEFSLLKKRIISSYKALEKQKKEWESKKHLRTTSRYEEYMSDEDYSVGTDEERKESAGDHFSKKATYRQSPHHRNGGPPRKTHVLEEEDHRCMNCLVPYEKHLNANGKCIHHPGYLGTDGKWTCCKKKMKSLASSSTHDGCHGDHNVEFQKNSHRYNGCQKADSHTWKLHKTKKCSDRKTKNKKME